MLSLKHSSFVIFLYTSSVFKYLSFFSIISSVLQYLSPLVHFYTEEQQIFEEGVPCALVSQHGGDFFIQYRIIL
jgi:hypothetical protein